MKRKIKGWQDSYQKALTKGEEQQEYINVVLSNLI